MAFGAILTMLGVLLQSAAVAEASSFLERGIEERRNTHNLLRMTVRQFNKLLLTNPGEFRKCTLMSGDYMQV